MPRRWLVSPSQRMDAVWAHPGLTEIQNPLIKPRYERICVRVVHESLAEIRDWDWTQWSGISEPLADAVARETTLQWCRASEDYVRDSPLQLGGMHAGLQRNVRESVIDLGKLGRFGPPG